jgi:hypothetical protein
MQVCEVMYTSACTYGVYVVSLALALLDISYCPWGLIGVVQR